MINQNYKKSLLENFPSLSEILNSSLSGDFFQTCVLLTAPEGQQIFNETDPAQYFPLVLEGSIRVYKADSNGKTLGLYDVNPGESCVLSTSSIMGNQLYPANGKVDSKLTAVGVPRTLFFKIMEQSPLFRNYIFGIFSERLSALLETIEAISFQKLDYRLLKYLKDKGPEIKTTHQKIADDLGSSREIVSRLLKRFEKEKILNLERERIVVNNSKLLILLDNFV